LNILLNKFKEVLYAVVPIVILVIILNVTIVHVPSILLFQFIIGAVALMLGLSILLLGVDKSFLPLGTHMGQTLVKSKKLWIAIIIGFILGFFIVLAEPSIQVLATQVSFVSDGLLSTGLIRTLAAMGSGVLLSLGIARIIKKISLRILLCIILTAAFILSFFASSGMLAIAFDAVGASTGAVTNPIILALAIGIEKKKKNSKTAEEDSFGLVGVAALGAVFGILILNLFVKTSDVQGILTPPSSTDSSLLGPFLAEIPSVAVDSLLTLLPIFAVFIIFQIFKFKLPRKHFRKQLAGFLYAYIGLFLFFVGVNAGFMNMGNMIGYGVASLENKAILVGVGFLLGMLIVLTEPAVYVFTHQIEEITNGYIKRKMVLVFLAIGVAFSIGLSMLRIVVPGIMLWHYLLPGFRAIVVLMFITPRLFVGIGVDSGAVAAGPMTATFVLAFTQGASDSIEYSNILVDSFGVIAMVTMMPIIAIQILGVIFKMKSKKSGVQYSNDV
jgi:hypothetical protein